MTGIRILMACPNMKRSDAWKELLSQEPDIEVVWDASDPIDSLLEAGNAQADVVLIDLPPEGRDPGLSSHLLAEYPQLKVIAVSQEGDVAVAYETGIIRKQLSDVSPQSLTWLIRALAVGGP